MMVGTQHSFREWILARKPEGKSWTHVCQVAFGTRDKNRVATLRNHVYRKPSLTQEECGQLDKALGLSPGETWAAQLRDPRFLDPAVRRFYEEQIRSPEPAYATPETAYEARLLNLIRKVQAEADTHVPGYPVLVAEQLLDLVRWIGEPKDVQSREEAEYKGLTSLYGLCCNIGEEETSALLQGTGEAFRLVYRLMMRRKVPDAK